MGLAGKCIYLFNGMRVEITAIERNWEMYNINYQRSDGKRVVCRFLAMIISVVLGVGSSTGYSQLFVGLEGSAPVTRSSDLSGFPDVSWTDHFAFDVSGAAATPEGLLYLCNGAFTTKLYTSASINGPAVFKVTLDKDMSALAYGRGKLFGYSNYADPKGIYEIDVVSGVCTLVLDVYTGTSFRFFALDYNPADDLFYGYTEYGDSGLYSINIDTGEMLKLAGSIPASNGQGRGMAVGRNTVFLTATRGDDGIAHYAYDLDQGAGGVWQAFTQAYPEYHSTGGAAYILQPGYDVRLSISGICPDRITVEVADAVAHGKVAIIYAKGEGSVKVPNGTCAGTQLGLNATVKLAGVWNADSSGGVQLSTGVPAGFCNGGVLVQAMDMTTCTVTKVVSMP